MIQTKLNQNHNDVKDIKIKINTIYLYELIRFKYNGHI